MERRRADLVILQEFYGELQKTGGTLQKDAADVALQIAKSEN